MSNAMDDTEIRATVALLSSERLSVFVQIAGTERDAVELHHATMELAAALMPVIGLVEISLRNAVCEQLRTTFAVPDWLMHPPAPFVWKGEEEDAIRTAQSRAQRDAYSKKSQADKKALDALAFPNGVPTGISHEKRAKARQKKIPVTAGQIIAHLTMFFWKRLFSDDYNDILWKRCLRNLFPNKKITRAQIAVALETIYLARNRIAHHEPIFGKRQSDTMNAIEFIVQNFSSKIPSEESILAKMTLPYRKTLNEKAHHLNSMLAKFTMDVE